MSCKVLIVPEDPTHNGHILKPLIERLSDPDAMTRLAPPSGRAKVVGATLALVLAAQVLFAVVVGHASLRLPAMPAAMAPKNAAAVGDALLHPFIVPFEIASVLLLVSMIGAVVLARRRA